ncbi:hypothetical protein BVX97_02365, partial [bacterium E08(2017)]
IVGEKFGGRLTIFQNTNPDSSPSFTDAGYVQVGGSTFVASGGGDSIPEVADWNNDGRMDIICGGFDGRVTLLLDTATSGSPVFTSSSLIQDGPMALDVGYKASPCVVDWNQDGKKDLLVGGEGSGILFFENVGTDASPVFAGSVPVQAGGMLIDIAGNPRPVVTDWDRDGVQDLIVGHMDATLWFYKRTADDNDADGMADWWENRHLPAGTSSTGSADEDGDGINNADEFKCNTNPDDADDVLKVEVITQSGSDLTINWDNKAGVTYVVECCPDLTAGAWSNISAGLTSGSHVVSPSRTEFYRITVP